MWIIFLIWFLIIFVVAAIVLFAARYAAILGELPNKKGDEMGSLALAEKEKFGRRSEHHRVVGNEVRIMPQHDNTMRNDTGSQFEVRAQSSVVELKGMSKRNVGQVDSQESGDPNTPEKSSEETQSKKTTKKAKKK